MKRISQEVKGPEFYDTVYANRYLGDKARIRAQEVAKHVVGSVLDLGCGSGYLAEFAEDYIGVDFSLEAVRRARKLQLPKSPKAVFAVADIRDLGEEYTADTVAMLEVLEHLENPAEMVWIAHRLARKRIVVTVPRKLKAESPAHVWGDWSAEDVLDLLGERAQCLPYRRWWLGVKDL